MGARHISTALPALIDYHGSHHVYGLPQLDGSGVKAGQHRAGRVLADLAQHPPAYPDNLVVVTAFVRDRLPHLSLEP